MDILWTIIVGFIVGVIAKFLHPGRENMGFIVTTLLGIAGSFLAGYVGQALGWYHAGQGAGFIGSIVGAFVLLLIYGFVKGKAAS
ncbi:GlsB/YeaQ/YmgE family stress response membrane protein [Collimonas sp. NPDC087041]|uniref:GlsB/YeaQ/YmgE family stress response membrane protein n=1 Tax=Collimonas sp. NPDC087041 TaxID=3363960 RepID=UPI00381B831F